jgi:mono/diheme cytochrome c family protein
MTEADMRDLRAYIFTLPPSDKANQPHELRFPFSIRLGVVAWKWLNFTPGPLPQVAGRDEAWTRGRYLVEALGHCAECHTPRDALGGLEKDKWLAGSADGAEGEAAPNLTPDPQTGLGDWSEEDIAFALQLGMTPDGDSLGSLMAEVVEKGTSQLSESDIAAMVAYLQSLPPIVHKTGS